MGNCFRKQAVCTARLLPVCQLATGNPVPNDLWIKWRKWPETAEFCASFGSTGPIEDLDHLRYDTTVPPARLSIEMRGPFEVSERRPRGNHFLSLTKVNGA